MKNQALIITRIYFIFTKILKILGITFFWLWILIMSFVTLYLILDKEEYHNKKLGEGYYYDIDNSSISKVDGTTYSYNSDSIYIISNQYYGHRLRRDNSGEIIVEPRENDYWIVDMATDMIYKHLSFSRFNELRDSLGIKIELEKTFDNHPHP